MDSLAHGASLARALIGLARSRATGTLRISAGRMQALVAVQDGRLCSMCTSQGDGDTLGDVLARCGDLDWRAHEAALYEGPPAGPVGAWLIRTGAASRSAVAFALRQQLELRMFRCFEWQPIDYTFSHEVVDRTSPRLEEPLDAIDVALAAMRRAMDGLPVERVQHLATEGPYVATDLGRTLLSRRAALLPVEFALVAATVDAADTGAGVGAGQRASAAHRRMLVTSDEDRRRGLAMLTLVGALRADVPAAGCTLLLRKARQLRAHATPAVLLDLPRHAPPHDARRALRRLARDLHPDRLGPAAPAALRQVSTDVMTALSGAEEALRVRLHA